MVDMRIDVPGVIIADIVHLEPDDRLFVDIKPCFVDAVGISGPALRIKSRERKTDARGGNDQ